MHQKKSINFVNHNNNKCNVHRIKVTLVMLMLNILHVIGYKVKKSGNVYILGWTPEYTTPFTALEKEQRAFELRNCTFQNCFFTSDHSYFSNILDFDVIIFNTAFITNDTILPRQRSLFQKYIMVATEPAGLYPVEPSFDEYFNFTWTYKLDSDVPFPYIIARNKRGEVIGPKINMHWMKIEEMKETSDFVVKKLRDKKIAAVAFVSTCDFHQRLNFIRELQKHLKKYGHRADIYGHCGDYRCPRGPGGEQTDECYALVESNYYFYLAFENSFGADYVSEKLLSALQHFTVPVVLGDANYSRFMPNGTYLDALKLGPAELANRMNEIISDRNTYYDFFRWHEHYSFHNTDEDAYQREVCALCELLNNKTLMQQSTVFSNLSQWWNEKHPVLHYDYTNTERPEHK